MFQKSITLICQTTMARRLRDTTLRVVGLLLVMLVLFSGSSALADEPFVAFLNRLRETKHYDVAEFYLQQMESSDLLTPEEKKQIPFRRAQVLFEKSRTQRREDAIDSFVQSAELAQRFAEQATELDQRLDAVNLLAAARTVLIANELQSAELTLNQIHQVPETAKKIRDQYGLIVGAYQDATNWLRTELTEAKTSKDAARRAKIPDNRLLFLNYIYQDENARFQSAETFAPDSDEFKQQMTALEKEAADNQKKYTGYHPFDMYFQLLQIRSLEAQGKIDEAGPLLDNVLGFSLANPVYADVRRQAALEGLNIWLTEEDPKVELAIQQLETVLDEIPKEQWSEDIAQQLRLGLARAHRLRVTETDKLDKPTSDQRTQANFSRRRSEQIIRELAKEDSSYAGEAKTLMAEWQLRGPAQSRNEVNTFADARENGFNLLLEARDLQQQLAGSEEQADAATRDSTEAQIQELADQALSWFDRAFELVNPDTRRADINMTRVYQCQCYWMKQQYLETSLIGQFLLDRFPNEIGTTEAAALAANALNQMVVEGKKSGESVAYEQQRMATVCKEVLEKWPTSKEAGDLAYLLVTVAVEQGDLPAAVQAVSQLAADNPRRGNAALYVGLAHINQAQRQQQAQQGTAEQWKQLTETGRTYLESAVGASETEPSTLYFYGVSQLAQWYNDQQQFGKTIQLLEQTNGSVIDRIAADDPLLTAADLQVNLIQSDLLAQLGQMATTGDASAAASQGARLLDLLSKKIEGNPRKDTILQSFYALTLSKMKEQFVATTDPTARKTLSQAMLQIFQPVSESSNDWRLLFSIGDSVAKLRDQLPADQAAVAKQMNQLALSSFRKALQVSQNDQSPNIAAYQTELSIGIAAALSADGQYQQAETALKKILDQNSSNPKLQLTLCQLYLDWGVATKEKAKLIAAINGGLPQEVNGRNVNQMAGWQNLARRTISNESLAEIFWQAFSGLSRTKYEYTQLTGDKKIAEHALSEIRKQKQRTPEMGGPQWRSQLDQITRKLQEQLGQKVTGIDGL